MSWHKNKYCLTSVDTIKRSYLWLKLTLLLDNLDLIGDKEKMLLFLKIICVKIHDTDILIKYRIIICIVANYTKYKENIFGNKETLPSREK